MLSLLQIISAIALTYLNIASSWNNKVVLLGLEELKNNETVPIPLNEISGITFDHHYNIYAISDLDNYIFQCPFDTDHTHSIFVSQISPHQITNEPLDDNEDIAILKDLNNSKSYFIITGARYLDNKMKTMIRLYDSNRRFLKLLPINSLFESSLESYHSDSHKYSIESISITSDYKMAIWMGTVSLIQDDCKNCIRMVINALQFEYNDTPSWMEMYEFRYDTDGANVIDVAIVKDDLSCIIVLERDSQNNIKGYEIDIKDLGEDYDIKDCKSLKEEECVNMNKVVQKSLVIDFNDFEATRNTDLEAIVFTEIEDERCPNGHFGIAFTDNDDPKDATRILYLCLTEDRIVTEATVKTINQRKDEINSDTEMEWYEYLMLFVCGAVGAVILVIFTVVLLWNYERQKNHFQAVKVEPNNEELDPQQSTGVNAMRPNVIMVDVYDHEVHKIRDSSDREEEFMSQNSMERTLFLTATSKSVDVSVTPTASSFIGPYDHDLDSEIINTIVRHDSNNLTESNV